MVSLLCGSIVKKDKVSLTAPPKILFQSLAKPWVLATKTLPILAFTIDCLRKSENGNAIIKLKIKDDKSSPEQRPGITPKILLIILIGPTLGMSCLKSATLAIRILRIILATISTKTAAIKNPTALAKPWEIGKNLVSNEAIRA